MLNNTCPICGNSPTTPSVSRNELITMQNYVYQNYEDAVKAQTGSFNLYICPNCGFAYNATFNSQLLTYDENYNNNVPSSIFQEYYKKIADFLYQKFSLEGKFVIDIGCGKGNFLSTLCSIYPDVEGLGIDPSYETDSAPPLPSNLKFVQDVFREEYVTQTPSLIICRHVLEHIERPLEFLKAIRTGVQAFPQTPFFIEVPDLEWIIDNNAFWDFCYEHCNYFTTDSLKNTLRFVNFDTNYVKKEFNGQYLWAIGQIDNSQSKKLEDLVSKKLISYSTNEKNLIADTKVKLKKLKREGNTLVIWGMATKGVVFCNIIDSKKNLFDYCIDINEKKMKCFVPHTGHLINAPDILSYCPSSKLVIVIMNPNYLNEIQETCKKMNLFPQFIDANGNELAVR